MTLTASYGEHRCFIKGDANWMNTSANTQAARCSRPIANQIPFQSGQLRSSFVLHKSLSSWLFRGVRHACARPTPAWEQTNIFYMSSPCAIVLGLRAAIWSTSGLRARQRGSCFRPAHFLRQTVGGTSTGIFELGYNSNKAAILNFPLTWVLICPFAAKRNFQARGRHCHQQG